jgi:hypothetical protein
MFGMEMLCASYGLRLVCSFALPGMQEATGSLDELPTLTLVLQDAAELERVWSGASGPPEWRGRLGDGRELVLERGLGGDLLFTYGDLARFRLDPTMRRLDCAPRVAGLDWQRALISKVVPTISVMRGREALHAAAIDAPDGVVAVLAASGAGKSTLALEFLRRGWPLFADDVLTLAQAADGVRALPGTPHMNVAPNLPDAIDPQALGSTLGVLAGELWLAAHASTAHPRPVRMLCLLERGVDLPLEIQALRPSPLPLAPYLLGLSTDPQRMRSRFCLYADLMNSATLVRLTAGLEHRPGQLADLVEQSLAHQPEVLVAAGR